MRTYPATFCLLAIPFLRRLKNWFYNSASAVLSKSQVTVTLLRIKINLKWEYTKCHLVSSSKTQPFPNYYKYLWKAQKIIKTQNIKEIRAVMSEYNNSLVTYNHILPHETKNCPDYYPIPTVTYLRDPKVCLNGKMVHRASYCQTLFNFAFPHSLFPVLSLLSNQLDYVREQLLNDGGSAWQVEWKTIFLLAMGKTRICVAAHATNCTLNCEIYSSAKQLRELEMTGNGLRAEWINLSSNYGGEMGIHSIYK